MKAMEIPAHSVPRLTGTELAEAIRTGRISSRKCLEVFVQRAEKLNPQLNAIVVLDVQRARKRADDADAALSRGELWGPLHGVPCTVKEDHDVAGLPTSLGFPQLKDRIATENETTVSRLLAAGAIIYGKCNLPLDAMDIQSFNAVYGSTSNPWNLSKTPGGSSGGSAVSVAVGFTPFCLGGDVGGSIRIPAAFCGIYGHKPTYKIIPKRGPHSAKKPKEISVRGPLAKSPEDLQMLMEIMAGADDHIISRGWQLRLPKPSKSALREFRVAMWADDPSCPVHDDLVNAADRVAGLLEQVGCTVDRNARPVGFDAAQNVKMYLTLVAANTAAKNVDVPQSLKDYVLAREQQEEVRDSWEHFFDTFDVLICPSFATPAFEKDESEARHKFMNMVKNGQESKIPYYKGLFWAFLTNTGLLPSTTFPCGVGECSGLPVGLNVVSREFNDLICIDFARLLKVECGLDFTPPPQYASDMNYQEAKL